MPWNPFHAFVANSGATFSVNELLKKSFLSCLSDPKFKIYYVVFLMKTLPNATSQDDVIASFDSAALLVKR